MLEEQGCDERREEQEREHRWTMTCGGLASDGEHVVLVVREETDLLVLAITGAAPLTGLDDQ